MQLERAIKVLKIKRDLTEVEQKKKKDALETEFIEAADVILEFFAAQNK